jgi:hypothetical protein
MAQLGGDNSECNVRTCEFSRSVVGSAGTRQPASPPRAAHTHACRRAWGSRTTPRTCLRPRLSPANSLSAVRARAAGRSSGHVYVIHES